MRRVASFSKKCWLAEHPERAEQAERIEEALDRLAEERAVMPDRVCVHVYRGRPMRRDDSRA